jgi:uncharacterized membrane protein
MSNIPVQVIVAAFATPDRAGQLMADLKAGRKEGLIGIVDAAVVVKDADGKLKVTDSKRRSTKGFITGGLIGGVIGLLAGPVGWAALGGGAIGALIGKLRGAPLKAEMTDIGSALTPNSSAIVAVIEHTWVSRVEAALAAEGARIVREEIKADIAAQLNAGGSVLYTAAAGDVAAGAARVADIREAAQVSAIAASDSGVFIGDAVITDEEPVEERPADASVASSANTDASATH